MTGNVSPIVCIGTSDMPNCSAHRLRHLRDSDSRGQENVARVDRLLKTRFDYNTPPIPFHTRRIGRMPNLPER
jgi:hypothetical protein